MEGTANLITHYTGNKKAVPEILVLQGQSKFKRLSTEFKMFFDLCLTPDTASG